MNFLRYYNQNRKFIWLVIIAIIVLIIAIQAMNAIVRNRNKNQTFTNNINENDYKNNLRINVLISDSEVQEQEELVIDQFIRLCNAEKVEEAYNLLTSDCKEELYKSLEEFKKSYWTKYFSTTKLYSKEKYKKNTYRIHLYEDVLTSMKNIEDYFTVQKEDGVTKLNIGGYIQSEKKEKTTSNEYLEIKVKNRKIYKEYEIYDLEITNLTYKTILLDSKEKTKTMYIKDKDSIEYYAVSYEVLLENLCIKPKATQTVSIKYTKEYNLNRTINSLIFEDIILDYDVYKEKSKKSEYTDRMSFKVNL